MHKLVLLLFVAGAFAGPNYYGPGQRYVQLGVAKTDLLQEQPEVQHTLNTAPASLIAEEEQLVEEAKEKLSEKTTEKKDVVPSELKFKVFTKKGEEIDLDLDKPVPSQLDVNKPLKVYIHDHLESGYNDASNVIRGYQKYRDVNLVIVDWGMYANNEMRHTINVTVPQVGEVVGQMMQKLIEGGVKPRKMHLIGFGFAAHIAGIAGKKVQQQNKAQKLQRITGLDPFGPGFNLQPEEKRLTENDAVFVDAIRTSSLSMNRSVRATFFPNGGFHQPGCQAIYNCDHRRARDMWVESLWTDKGFYALRCPNTIAFEHNFCHCNEMIIMGEKTPDSENYSPRGKYYLKTKDHSPLAKGKPT